MSYTSLVGLALLASLAGATPIPVDIEGRAEGNFYRFDVAGDDVHYRISTSEGPLVVGLCAATPCNVVQEYSGGVLGTVRFGESALLNGVAANETTGSIQLLFTVDLPQEQIFSTSVQLALIGEITAYGDFPAFPELFRFTFQGSGAGTVFGRHFEDGSSVIQGARFSIPGKAEIVPEPGTAALLVTGLLGLAFWRRTR